jgi:hypothetical protein
MRLVWSGLLTLMWIACADPVASTAPDAAAAADASPAVDASSDAGPGPADTGVPPLSCTCDPDEQCPACFEHIGRCCYGDATLGGAYAGILAQCEAHPACKACCKECLALSCDELQRRGGCPQLLPDE